MSPLRPFSLLSSRTHHAWVQWRAGRILDPVRKLQYLRSAHRSPPRPSQRATTILLALPVALLVLLPMQQARVTTAVDIRRSPIQMPDFGQPEPPVPEVWLVDKRPEYEIYSNGLRIETKREVPHKLRQFSYLRRNTGQLRTDGLTPAGIVYHTTESHIVEFAPANSQFIQRAGESLIEYVARRTSYHFLIDRFGRAHRVVAERDAADHAGHSIWADRERVYLGLNHSFLGVAFESATSAGDQAPATVTQAQWHTAAILTQLLRYRYSIPSFNCITHAQVSINPDNHRIGNHTDWASNFAFQRLGLPDNYAAPVPAMIFFGFSYDEDFVGATGPRMWRGLSASEEFLRQAATAAGVPVPAYRNQLRKDYKRISDEIAGPAGLLVQARSLNHE